MHKHKLKDIQIQRSKQMAILFEQFSLIQFRLSLYRNHKWTEFICAKQEPETGHFN